MLTIETPAPVIPEWEPTLQIKDLDADKVISGSKKDMERAAADAIILFDKYGWTYSDPFGEAYHPTEEKLVDTYSILIATMIKYNKSYMSLGRLTVNADISATGNVAMWKFGLNFTVNFAPSKYLV